MKPASAQSWGARRFAPTAKPANSAGGSWGKVSPQQAKDSSSEKSAPTGKNRPPKSPRGNGRGALSVTYSEPSGESGLGEIAEVLLDSKIFDRLVAALNTILILPKDIDVHFEQCGQINAFYIPGERRIAMCYELFGQFAEIFGGDDEEELGIEIINAAVFTFFHELGHALIHVLDIPITGREEDAADDLAALIALNMGEDGEDIVLSALSHFASMADEHESSADELAFWDEHSLDGQRAYNMACIIYGSNPEKFEDMVGDEGLPEARAERCPDEFKQKSNSWERLLDGHIVG